MPKLTFQPVTVKGKRLAQASSTPRCSIPPAP
jgi:hypothetical protein